MSFSVRAGDIPSSRHSSSSAYSLSSRSQSYSQSQIMPFSPPVNHIVTYNFPTPDLTNLYSRQVPGPDPAKYKTSICRNWSSRGTCTFRGCTFAHGYEELRMPTRSPLQLSHSRPSHPTRALTHANNHNNTSHSHSQLNSHSYFNSGRAFSWEHLVSLLLANVKCRRDSIASQGEANRTLEDVYQKKEAETVELQRSVDALRQQWSDLLLNVTSRNEMLRGKVAKWPQLNNKFETILNRTDALLKIKDSLDNSSGFSTSFSSDAAVTDTLEDVQNILEVLKT